MARSRSGAFARQGGGPASATAATEPPSLAPGLFSPRDYQLDCLRTIHAAGDGNWLCQLATGLGKTVIMSMLKQGVPGINDGRPLVPGRMLILSHRDTLVHQPRRYFSCSYGIEQAALTSNGEEVVSASVQSLVRRLKRFGRHDFDALITDECHHSAADTYCRIYEHFSPRLHLGFTATPNRGDGVGLADVFDAIIFQVDLRWGIENGWLADIDCMRVDIGYDLAGVRTRMGDLAVADLERAVNIEGANQAIADAYRRLAVGPTLIFGVTVAHCRAIAELIPGAVVVDAATRSEDRARIFSDFERGYVPVIVNCEIVTEGTDLPAVRTVIMARPTKSITLYAQMVGRGTRRTPGKDRCLLIDCVGSTRLDLCTAPNLIGLDVSAVPESYQKDVVGDLLKDLPPLIERMSDTPESWIRNVEHVDLWAKSHRLDLRGVRFFQHADGTLSVDLPDKWLCVSSPDLRGHSWVFNSAGLSTQPMPIQDAIDLAWRSLNKFATEERPLWSLASFKRWGREPASDKQRGLVGRFCPRFDTDGLTKGQANLILQKKMNHRKGPTWNSRGNSSR